MADEQVARGADRGGADRPVPQDEGVRPRALDALHAHAARLRQARAVRAATSTRRGSRSTRSRALLPVAKPAVPEEVTRDFESALANLRLAYAKAAAEGSAGAEEAEPRPAEASRPRPRASAAAPRPAPRHEHDPPAAAPVARLYAYQRPVLSSCASTAADGAAQRGSAGRDPDDVDAAAGGVDGEPGVEVPERRRGRGRQRDPLRQGAGAGRVELERAVADDREPRPVQRQAEDRPAARRSARAARPPPRRASRFRSRAAPRRGRRRRRRRRSRRQPAGSAACRRA